MTDFTLQFDTAADLESALLDALQNNEGHFSGIAAYLAQTGADAVAPEAKPTDADLIEQFIAHNSQFHRSADHPAWLYCKDGDGGYTSLRGDLFAATLRTLTQGNQS